MFYFRRCRLLFFIVMFLIALVTVVGRFEILIGLIYIYNKPPKFTYYWNQCQWLMDSKDSLPASIPSISCCLWTYQYGLMANRELGTLRYGL